MPFILFLASLIILPPANAQTYLSLLGGLGHRQLDGDKHSYQDYRFLAGQLSLGHRWKRWDLSLDTHYSFGKQNNLKMDYGNNLIISDYYSHSLMLGPTFKYHFPSSSNNWSVAPFLGPYINYTSFQSTHEFRDISTSDEDHLTSNNWGYGAKLGLSIEHYTPKSSWLENIKYELALNHTRYRNNKSSYIENNISQNYQGDSPDKLNESSITFLVGMSFGEKLWSKVKKIAGI